MILGTFCMKNVFFKVMIGENQSLNGGDGNFLILFMGTETLKGWEPHPALKYRKIIIQNNFRTSSTFTATIKTTSRQSPDLETGMIQIW